MDTDLERKAIGRIGRRMMCHLLIIWVITGIILYTTTIMIIVPIMIGLMCGIITGNMIFMYVVARSFEDD